TVDENLILRLGADERRQVYERFPVLGERRRLPAGSLSGGEQQMLTLGAVLARPPAVLIADEPTLGLAPLIIVQLLEVFKQLRDAMSLVGVRSVVGDVYADAVDSVRKDLGAVGQVTDITDADACAALAARAEAEHGRIDVLVNDAYHGGDFASFEDADLDAWR